ncbi:MAG: bifunctional 4-hydroxy-2-oxoglutarate aldolase/2-dehydro-3-deoxy-phosphogluconate aldolase [Treponema sp.]|jgi:2-dehydro-3-deoxyphosphogluconate aldolase/(4S)-4-hydroxy-2-oxoglutarate aldolase|nr:bifunctional 4-hydroxy-2-oxoglutarate aldolase/2-dehydro-3-deoxy-phosphogluconate aldolase [Treponema sp.]
MHAVLEELEKTGIVPVIKIDDAEKAAPLARALIAGGLPVMEVTFRTPQAEEAIRRISGEEPEMLLGAGTVLSIEQAERALAAGAKFIVSPGFNPKLVSHCVEKGVPVIPGCSNPSGIEQALELGLEAVKFFPAEQAGGLDYIKAVAAPYGQVKFMPTGGISAANIAKYISYEKVLACGGSWMAGAELINAGEFGKITALCREAVQTMLGFSPAHIGINCPNPEEAAGAAKLFGALFGFPLRDGNSSIFAGEGIELMKAPGLGKNGHLAVAANSLYRAAAHLERRGFRFKPESVKKDAGGKITAIYLQDEIAGFAVHLLQKK